jgi:hypothetical protein
MHGDLRKFRVVEAGAAQLGVIQVENRAGGSGAGARRCSRKGG